MSEEKILDGYLSLDQLAAQLGRSRRTIQRWQSLRIGPPVTKIGNQAFFSIASVKAWLERNEKKHRRAG